MPATAIADNVVPSHAPGSGAIRLANQTPRQEEQYRRRWFIKAPFGATREDPLHPSFWTNVSRHFTRHDVVSLLADDESWELEICIEAVRQSGCDVSVRKNYGRTAINMAGTPIGDSYRTEYRSGDGWCVCRVSDGFPVIRGHTLEVSAINQFHREQPKAA